MIKNHRPQAIINCVGLLPNKPTNNFRFQANKINNKSVMKILNLSIKNNLSFFINIGGHSIQKKLKEKIYLLCKNVTSDPKVLLKKKF